MPYFCCQSGNSVLKYMVFIWYIGYDWFETSRPLIGVRWSFRIERRISLWLRRRSKQKWHDIFICMNTRSSSDDVEELIFRDIEAKYSFISEFPHVHDSFDLHGCSFLLEEYENVAFDFLVDPNHVDVSILPAFVCLYLWSEYFRLLPSILSD